MDKETLKKLLQQQNLGPEYMVMDPHDIDMTYALGMDPQYFWNHHGNTKEDYAELMEKLDKVYDAMASGMKVDDMMSWQNKDRELRDTAYAFFAPERAITVERWDDGKIHFAGDGRHRIMMAQELNMPIPVRMTYDELEKGKAISEDFSPIHTVNDKEFEAFLASLDSASEQDSKTEAKAMAQDYDKLLAVTDALCKDPMFAKKGMHVEMMDPDWITVTDDDYIQARRPDKNGMTSKQYEDVSKGIPSVCDGLLEGKHLEDMMQGDSEMAKAARSYFDPKNMIRADVYGGDEIRLDGHGVQQLLAAQTTGMPVPVYSSMQMERELDIPRQIERRLPDLPYEDPPFMKDDSPTRRLPWDLPEKNTDKGLEL